MPLHNKVAYMYTYNDISENDILYVVWHYSRKIYNIYISYCANLGSNEYEN